MQAVLITSANRGLGLEFAAQYVADGWRVYAACRQPRSAEKLQRLTLDKKDRIDILAMDVTNASSVDRAAAKIGSAAIDVLINSAGITGKPGQKTGDVDYVSWAHVLDVNTMRPLRVTEAFVDHLARSRRNLS
jgi:NAD(P)-dependent dehydrogenase (short-subunit alcohol dehydrogenase family)